MNIDFEQYLQGQGYRLNTIRDYQLDTERFTSWCHQVNQVAERADYACLVDYVAYCRATCSPRTIQGRINSLRHYFNGLIAAGRRIDNPAAELRLRGMTRSVPHDLLSWEELEQLYQNYPSAGLVGKRNKTMLGLLIYQGLNTGELSLLETADLQVAEGRIHVPGTGRSNSRVVRLEAHQVIQLQNYLLTQRPALQVMSQKQGTRLFFSSGRGTGLHNSYAKLLRSLQKVSPRVKNLGQLRASVITHWLTTTHLRQVQYQAGHRYVSSTEHYRTNRLEGLQEQLESLHPLE
jgi:site-specific recombinase XerD